jgi:nuclear GTP-binding protein
MDFLTQVANKQGRLHNKGEADTNTVAINVINDWQRGKLPYFVAPPRDFGESLAEDSELSKKNGKKQSRGNDDDDDDDEEEDLTALEELNKKQVIKYIYMEI